MGTAQTLAWASSYYLPAMLAAPMARDLGVATPTIFAVFSMALILSALVGPAAGRLIDHHGGRPLLIATNVVFAAALALLGSAEGLWTLIAAWVLMGLAMGAGLYEAAFAALVRLYGSHSRNAITGITLLAGFASTVGWPLSAWLETQVGWRGACYTWAALHLLLGLPLNAWLPRAAAPGSVSQEAAAEEAVGAASSASPTAAPPPRLRFSRDVTAALLSMVFMLTWFVSTAMAAHLPTLMQAAGGTLALAVVAGALIGPAQVAGRLFEFGVLRRVSPLTVARGATLTHPLGALALWALGAPVAAAAFAILHGLGNGILTIAKGTLPLSLFGPAGYGARQGWIALPGRALQGLAPWLFGLALERWGAGALGLSASLGLAAFAILMLLAAPKADPQAATPPRA
ncbi:MAG: MFS transporter [Rubrivivax sp.]|nr:MFS transporter [Rubrivivax sp.]